MKIIDSVSQEDYVKFLSQSKYNHFLQSYEWGQACKSRHLKPTYLALVDEKNKIHAACLAFRKETPLKMCYFYSPRGIIIDYENKNLLKQFTEALKEYLKKENAIYFKMDPGIAYQDIDDEARPLEGGENNYELFNYLLKLGYKHQGFNKLYEKNQPRYTFRIDTTKTIDEIEKKMNKSFLKKVKRSYNYDLEVTNEYDNATFYHLMKSIANKDSFNGYPEEFYKAFEKEFSKGKNGLFLSIKVYPDKIIEKAQNELASIKKDIEDGKITEKKMPDTNNVIARLEKDIQTFMPYAKKYPDGLVTLVQICAKTNHGMWTVYIGNDELATYTFAVNRIYYECIKIACEEKKEFLDVFGTCGDPHTTYLNLAGLHEYKRQIGGKYIEFMGEFDLVNKKFWYKALPFLLKIYRKIKK